MRRREKEEGGKREAAEGVREGGGKPVLGVPQGGLRRVN